MAQRRSCRCTARRPFHTTLGPGRQASRPEWRSYRQACLQMILQDRADRQLRQLWASGGLIRVPLSRRRSVFRSAVAARPHCAGAHERSWMGGDQDDQQWLVRRDLARARSRSPHVRRTKGSVLKEVLTIARNVLAGSPTALRNHCTPTTGRHAGVNCSIFARAPRGNRRPKSSAILSLCLRKPACVF